MPSTKLVGGFYAFMQGFRILNSYHTPLHFLRTPKMYQMYMYNLNACFPEILCWCAVNLCPFIFGQLIFTSLVLFKTFSSKCCPQRHPCSSVKTPSAWSSTRNHFPIKQHIHSILIESLGAIISLWRNHTLQQHMVLLFHTIAVFMRMGMSHAQVTRGLPF